MSNSRQTLDELGHHYQTDKASGRHSYLGTYDAVLSSRRDTARAVLEIGVKTGASLRMWRDYFSRAEIVGIDRNSICKQQAGDRISIEIGNQNDFEFLDRISAARVFDVIVDDGSHQWSHQIGSFQHLWPKLSQGGVYIVEDLHTSLATKMESHGKPGAETAAAFFARLARNFAATGPGPEETTDPIIEQIRRSIYQISFGKKCCIILKR